MCRRASSLAMLTEACQDAKLDKNTSRSNAAGQEAKRKELVRLRLASLCFAKASSAARARTVASCLFQVASPKVKKRQMPSFRQSFWSESRFLTLFFSRLLVKVASLSEYTVSINLNEGRVHDPGRATKNSSSERSAGFPLFSVQRFFDARSRIRTLRDDNRR